jgi:hypothetical protein
MQNKKGNILFLILIAVALFAALSYAVTNTSRSGADSVSTDKAKILAAEIIQYSTQLEQAVTRMRLINNIPEYGIDLSASGYSDSSANGTCTKNECKLFNIAGGGIPPKLLPFNAWHKSNTTMTGTWRGKAYFRVIQVTDVGSDLPELLLMYPGIDPEVCKAINKLLKIPLDGTGDSTFDYFGTSPSVYSGTLNSFPILNNADNILGNTAQVIKGKNIFCVDHTNSNSNYYFYHVLIAR